jgi:periplasmic protein TonB
MSRNPHKPNWLLRSLILFSIGIHTVMVFHLSGVYSSRAMAVIEFSLRDESVLPQRTIPRPRLRPKNLPKPVSEMKTIAENRLAPSIKPIKIDPYKADMPDTLGASIGQQLISGVPQTNIPGNGIEAWQPVAVPSVSSDTYDSPDSYLEMVRFKIEKNKLYPATAKNRNIKGRVVVSLVISLKGEVHSLTIKKSSGDDMLDNAALSAVQRAVPFPAPPGKYFKKDISLTIPILFELI